MHRLGGVTSASPVPAPLRSDSLPASPGPLHRAATDAMQSKAPSRPSTAPAPESPGEPQAVPSDTPAALPAPAIASTQPIIHAQQSPRVVLESYASNKTPAGAPEPPPSAPRAPESPFSGWRSVTPPLKVRRRNSIGARPRGTMLEGEEDDLPLSARATATRKSQGASDWSFFS